MDNFSTWVVWFLDDGRWEEHTRFTATADDAYAEWLNIMDIYQIDDRNDCRLIRQ